MIEINNIPKAIRFVAEKFKLSDTQIFVNPINKKQDQPEVRGQKDRKRAINKLL